ncbi:MAG: hypothetical protein KDD70_09240 [Bdellovibrionales bacterium]|nr:hypothetical protein [Bdellovibrionales bacterium]
MKSTEKIALVALCISFIVPILALAQSSTVVYRGMQMSLPVDSSELQDLIQSHNANVVGAFISSENLNTVHTTEAAYQAAVDDELDKIDAQLPLIEQLGAKIVLAFGFPPNGFTPNASPPHSRMFSDPTLQDWYRNIMVAIVQRYSAQIQSGLIIGIDILTEPADSSSEPNNGALDWFDLADLVIEDIRAVNSDIELILKPLYGTLDNLKKLPCINDYTNVRPGVHIYTHLNYQHTGEPSYGSSPFSISRPGLRQIENRILDKAAAFLRKQQNTCGADITEDIYALDSGEMTFPACAVEQDLFATDVLNTLERNDLSSVAALLTKAQCKERKRTQLQACNGKSKKAKSRCRKKANQKARKCLAKAKRESGGGNENDNSLTAQVRWKNWRIQSYDGTKNFDARYECDQQGNFTLVGQTDLYTAIDTFFANNALFTTSSSE